MRSTNIKPPFLSPQFPSYPALRQLVRVGGSSSSSSSSPFSGLGSVFPGFIEQCQGDMPILRDREACWVWEPNGNSLSPGSIQKARLMGSYQGLPLLAVSTMCCGAGGFPSLSSVSGVSSSSSGSSFPYQTGCFYDCPVCPDGIVSTWSFTIPFLPTLPAEFSGDVSVHYRGGCFYQSEPAAANWTLQYFDPQGWFLVGTSPNGTLSFTPINFPCKCAPVTFFQTGCPGCPTTYTFTPQGFSGCYDGFDQAYTVTADPLESCVYRGTSADGVVRAIYDLLGLSLSIPGPPLIEPSIGYIADVTQCNFPQNTFFFFPGNCPEGGTWPQAIQLEPGPQVAPPMVNQTGSIVLYPSNDCPCPSVSSSAVSSSPSSESSSGSSISSSQGVSSKAPSSKAPSSSLSSSSSSSSSFGGGIITICCPEGLPEVLLMTISSTTGIGYCDGSYYLVYAPGPGDKQWCNIAPIGNPPGGPTCLAGSVCLICSTDTTDGHWVLQVGGTPFDMGNPGLCNPLILMGVAPTTTFSNSSNCNCQGGPYNVLITPA